MSQTIDTSQGYDALEDDEVMYLAQKDDEQAVEEAQKRNLHPGGSPKEWATHPYFGDANTKGRTVGQVERMTKESPHHQDDPDDVMDDEDDEDEVVDYNEWSKEELLGELKDRELSLVGNKPELVKRLEEDDAKED